MMNERTEDDEDSHGGGRNLQDQSYADNDNFVYSKNDIKNLKNDQLLWNILPSYEFFNNQFIETQEPPVYEEETVSSGFSLAASGSALTSESAETRTGTNSLDSLGAVRTPSRPDRITFDDANNQWQSTILDNVDYLNNMTNTGNSYTDHLKIDTHFIKNVGEFNQPVEYVDPNTVYKQGDTINGIVTIENLSEDMPIKFQMFYLLLEGIVQVKDKTIKFLEMFDIPGSFHKGHVNRLITEYQDPTLCYKKVDNEGYIHSFVQQVIVPGQKYKRFFSFKIPNQLLENQTEHYNCVTHLNVLPEMGKMKDYSLMNSSAYYQVASVFIGKAKNYKFNPQEDNALVFNSLGEEYVILKCLHTPVNVVPILYHDPEIVVYQDLYFKHFGKRIDETLRIMNKIKMILDNKAHPKQISETGITQLIDSIAEQIKLENDQKSNQLYIPSNREKIVLQPPKDMKIFLPIQSLMKSSSTVQLETPYKMYSLKYIAPHSGQKPDTVNIPITIKSATPLKLKHFQVELGVLTVGSTCQIPLEFTHDTIFKNNNPGKAPIFDRDTFKTNVIEHFRAKFDEFVGLSKQVSIENFNIEKKLIQDLRCLSTLSEKTINLLVREREIIQNGKVVKSPTIGTGESKFELKFNLENLLERGSPKLKPFDDFTLVPSFQSSNLCRMYYFRIWLQFNNTQVLFKVPAYIENRA